VHTLLVLVVLHQQVINGILKFVYASVVTLYATLGDDAVIHGLNESECSIVITSFELMLKLKV
jgi:long-subunit acyl-CoA synthetase (AMP-forming)